MYLKYFRPKWPWLALFILFGLSIFHSDFPTKAHNQPSSLVVVYADGNTLHVWRERDFAPRKLADLAAGTANISVSPLISPGATWVIFRREDALWIANLLASFPAPRALVRPDALNADKSQVVLNAAWLNDNTIIFNTFRFSPQSLVKQQPANDLWRVDVTSGKVTQLLANGQGGAFAISPDSKHIVLTHPGDFEAQTRGTISVIDTEGQNRVKLLDYPFVNTGASLDFYPQPQWIDGTRFVVAIPDPNLVYATADLPPTALWELEIGGKTTRLGEIRADFFGLPLFSPDGQRILFARRIGTAQDNRIALLTAKRDGSEEQEIARDQIGVIEPARWGQTSAIYTFVRGQPGQLWIQTAQGLQRLPDNNTLAFNLVWADAATYVFATALGGSDELRYGNLGSTPTALITKRASGGEFDARRAQS
jgi:dipeptidyl aminopeptidase/acylaminoacyl peptidase